MGPDGAPGAFRVVVLADDKLSSLGIQ
jgi:hypothetical protein